MSIRAELEKAPAQKQTKMLKTKQNMLALALQPPAWLLHLPVEYIYNITDSARV